MSDSSTTITTTTTTTTNDAAANGGDIGDGGVSMTESTDKQCKVRIENIPLTIDDATQLQQLLSTYHPIDVRRLNGPMTGNVMVTLNDEHNATQLVNELNNQSKFGNVLKVKLIDQSTTTSLSPLTDGSSKRRRSATKQKQKLPPIDEQIIANICKTLQSTPKFYVNVLHLMNRMNLPPPYTVDNKSTLVPAPTPAATGSTQKQHHPQDKQQPNKRTVHQMQEHDEEDEQDQDDDVSKKPKTSSTDDTDGLLHIDVPPPAITPTNQGPSSSTKLPIQIKLNTSVQTPTAQSLPSGGQDKYYSRDDVISLTNLMTHKATEEELETINKKKKLELGTISKKLYIKNLAKQVDKVDLEFIFGRYFETRQQMNEQMTIVHYKEGRMKNQAFITFPNSQLASDALTDVQGFRLKDRPMLISYGKTM
ncbi:hypothetical protein SAMD00019534_019380 [Acytostelium subglobosum LB1]|uniref:hypothetical protein n=1 Tax=Acytostelium subglobosum LB1 TaxID=1410327 RepID=UPI000644DD61|nr:hypothetical protein SAMD00019534_019380 [Acytostelium subglobosum LB1]GAM18763.1 hypothetical protein SAMD00019534_019380 [Acytostelium subglobosum LB1]|eukprot:XP_012757983.1 hypothetical protein SAMD00019534_019380 [Acytostelium subglobosum LB1]